MGGAAAAPCAIGPSRALGERLAAHSWRQDSAGDGATSNTSCAYASTFSKLHWPRSNSKDKVVKDHIRVDSKGSNVSLSYASVRRASQMLEEQGEPVLEEFIRQTSLDTEGDAFAYHLPSETIIFFDWDDTLFPTAALGGYVSFNDKPSEDDEMQPMLKLWRAAVVSYLDNACALSTNVVILTNSVRPWVTKCVQLFIPELADKLDSVGGPKVIYANESAGSKEHLRKRWLSSELLLPARSCCACTAEEKRDEFMVHKRICMQREAREFYSRPGQTWKNLLSLGDGWYERDALHDISFRRRSPDKERLRTKTLVLPTAPSLSEITLRLRFSRLMLPAYVNFDGDIDLNLRAAADPLVAIADALGMPELKSVSFPRHAWGRAPRPAEHEALEALDSMAETVQCQAFYN